MRDPGAIRQNTGIAPRFVRTVLDIALEGGSDKNSKGTFLWEPKRIEPIGRVQEVRERSPSFRPVPNRAA